MTAGHGLWFVLQVRKGKGLTVQCQSFHEATQSAVACGGISWSVRGAIVSEGCLVGDYSLHYFSKYFPL